MAATFRLDIKGADLRNALARAGVRPVLLKGPAVAKYLYSAATPRAYADIDLLVDPSSLDSAERTLTAEGFTRFDPEAPVRQTDSSIGRAVGMHGASHAAAWFRARDGLMVDLHDSLPQVGASAEIVWRELSSHLEEMDIAGISTKVLDRPATALLVALHAAHHGPDWDRVATELDLAVEVFDDGVWTGARDLAVTLQAVRAMGIGLGLTEPGRALACKLSLDPDPTAAVRLAWEGAPWSETVLSELIEQRDVRALARLSVRLLVPTPAALRRGSALARRGRVGLAAAYVQRAGSLLRRLPGALAARRRARA